MKRSFKPWHLLPLVVMIIGLAFTMTSCGDDDDPTHKVIDYYLNVEEEFLVDGAPSKASYFYNPVTRMKEAIRRVYPTATIGGADSTVVVACDNEFYEYRALYNGRQEHITCMIHLMRVIMDGDRIKQSEKLKTYIYDINPKTEEE